MKKTSKIFVWLIIVFFCEASAVSANPASDTTYLGYDYARQQTKKSKNLSSRELDSRYQELFKIISSLKEGDRHYVSMHEWLSQDQKNWLNYRESNCWLKAYVYVYPESSKMFSADYSACVNEMNKQRLKFIAIIRAEIQNGK